MGVTLEGKQISLTYDGLLKSTDNNPITSAKVISDGNGNDLALKISPTTIWFPGVINFSETTNYINAPWVSQISNLQTQIDSNDTDISNLQGDVSTNTTNLTNLTNQYNTLSSDVNDLSNDVAQNTTDIADNTTNITSLAAGTNNVIGVRSNTNPYIDGNVTLAQGSNITLSQAGDVITIASSGGGGGGGSDSFNTIASTGEPDIVAQSGNDTLNIEKSGGITIANDNNTTTMTLGTDSSILAYRSYTDPIFNGLISDISDNTSDISALSATTQSNTSAITTNLFSINSLTTNVQQNTTNISLLQAADYVNTLEGLSGDITFSGTNIDISTNGQQIVLSASTGGGTSTTINNNASGRIITGSNTSDTLNAESTLTWVSNTLLVAGDAVLTGDITAVDANIGTINYSKYITIEVPSATYPYQGELSPIVGSSLTEGNLYYLNSSGVWTAADASSVNSSKNMLGIAVDTINVMIRGHIRNTLYAGFTDGEPLYIKSSAGGLITNIIPSTSGHIVRIIGYCVDGSARSIYFNPSNDYIEVT